MFSTPTEGGMAFSQSNAAFDLPQEPEGRAQNDVIFNLHASDCQRREKKTFKLVFFSFASKKLAS